MTYYKHLKVTTFLIFPPSTSYQLTASNIFQGEVVSGLDLSAANTTVRVLKEAIIRGVRSMESREAWERAILCEHRYWTSADGSE